MEKFQFDWEKELTPIPLDKSSHDLILQRITQLEKRSFARRLVPVFSGIGALAMVVSILVAQKDTLLDFVTGSAKLDVIQPQTNQSDTQTHAALPIDAPQNAPIQHMIWKRSGMTGEYWQNVETGESRSVETDHVRGIVQTAITEVHGNEHILYLIVTENGKIVSAQKIPQLNNDGKSARIIDVKRIKDTSQLKFVKDDIIDGNNVKVLEKNTSNPTGEEIVQQFYVDKTGLPLKIVTINQINGIVEEQTYKYNYLPQDASLFKAPTNITYEEMPAADATPGR